jgi:hypothetical protein
MNPKEARYVDIGLGVWLILSAFLLRQNHPQVINTFVVGVVVVVSAVVSAWLPVARYVTSAAGVWLIASLFAWPMFAAATVWNSFFVGIGIALSSLVGPIASTWSASQNQIDSTA